MIESPVRSPAVSQTISIGRQRILLALAAGMLVPLGWLTVLLFWPSPRYDSPNAVTVGSMVTAGDFSSWETIPIQDGRLKP